MFGKSFEEQVQEAIQAIRAKNLGVRNLNARIEGQTVTLTGTAPSKEIKASVMSLFTGMVESGNTVNAIGLEAVATAAAATVPAAAPAPTAAAPPPAQAAARVHEVSKGDTLSAIAKKYYGNANAYMKIFEANRDILKDPNVIHPGQKLKIPE